MKMKVFALTTVAAVLLAARGFGAAPTAPQAQPQAQQAAPADLTGTLEVVQVCFVSPPRSERWYYVTDEKTGRMHKLNFEAELPEGRRTGERVRIRGFAYGEDIHVPAKAQGAPAGMEVLGSAPEPTAELIYTNGTTGSTQVRKALVMLLVYSNYATNHYDGADIITFSNKFFAATGSSVNTAYLENTYGKIGFAGDVIICHIAAVSGTCDTGAWLNQGNAEAAAQGYNVNNYNHRVYITSGSCGWAGLAAVGGNWSMDFYTDGGTITHELGHNLGFNHASTQWNNTSAWNEYGDSSDFMGGAYSWRHNNGPHKVQKGWLTTLPVSGAGIYEIGPLEHVPGTIPYQQVYKLPSSSGPNGWPYYFSYKQAIGFDSGVGSYSQGVSIHRWNGTTGKTAAVARLSDGGTFTDSEAGFTVKQMSHDTNKVTIAVVFCSSSAQPYYATMTPEQLAARLRLLVDVTANSDCNPLTITAFDAVSAKGGSVTLTNNQLFYTPPGVFTGNDTFGFSVKNLLGETSSSVATIIPVSHATFVWDANGAAAGTGGSGTWNTTSATWDDGTHIWPSTGTSNVATFGGTVGTVTIAAGGVAANGLLFNTAGYVLQGSPLTLNGSQPSILVNSGADAVIGAPLAGTQGFSLFGVGTLSLAGANTLSGTVVVDEGTLQIGNGGASGDLGNAAVANFSALNFNRTGNCILPNIISGNGTVTQIGAGTTTLTGANTYSGPTLIAAGTLALAGGNNRLPTNNAVTFTGAGTLQLDGSQTLANLNVPPGNTGTVAGSGALVLGANGFLLGNEAASGNTTLDLSQLGTFQFSSPANPFQVTAGLNASASYSSMLKLATNTQITALSFVVGGSGSANIASTSSDTVELGQSTTINANTYKVGFFRNQGTLAFQSGLTDPNLTLRGSDGTSRVGTLYVGQINSGGQSATRVSTLDTTAGTLDAWVGTMIVAYNDRGNGNDTPNTASVVMGKGILDVTSLTLGKDKTGSTGGYTCSGTLAVSGGSVKVGTLTLGDRTGGLTVSGTFNLNGGAMLSAQTINPGAGTATRTFNWNDGTIRNYNASTDLTIASGLTLTTASNGTHRFDIDAGRTATVSAVINGTGTLTKSGAGKTTLNAANVYTGDTFVDAGTLALGASASINSTPAIAVAGGAVFDVSAVSGYTLPSGKTLGGSGGIKGSVVAATGSQLLAGLAGVAGTLTFSNNVTLNGQAFVFDLNSSPAAPNDKFAILGTLTNNGTSTIGLNCLAGNIAAGTYTLFNYVSRTGAGSFVLDRSYPNATLNVGATALTLVIGPGGSTDALVWQGDGIGNVWDVSATTNWIFGVTPGVFEQGHPVLFTDTGANSPAINLATGLQPSRVSVNAAQNYTFSTSTGGKLSGAMYLIKQGAGKLTLNTSNDYSGNTTISAGTLALGNASAIPGGPGKGGVTVDGALDLAGFGPTLNNLSGVGTVNNVSAGGTPVLTVLSTESSSFAGTISNSTGSVALNKTGPGTLTLSGANSFGGLTTIDAGTLALAGGNNRLPTNNAVTFTGAGTLQLDGSQTLANLNVPPGNTGTVAGSGALVLGANGFLLGNEAASGNTTLDLSQLGTFQFSSPANPFQVTAGLNASASYSSTLKLATNTQITALSFVVGGSGSANIASTSSDAVELGQSTTINANTNKVGFARNQGTLTFRSGLTSPTLTLRGSDGIARVGTLYVGEINSGGQSFTRISTLDTTAGTLDALVGTMIVAYNDRGSGADTPNNASVLMGSGTLDCTSLTLGKDKAGSTGSTACSGTLTVGGGTVKVGTLTLGDRTGGLTVSGIFNLNDGATLLAQTINPGAGTATRTFNWDEGTIRNYNASTDLTIASGLTLTLGFGGTHTFDIDAGRTATVSAVIAGSGALTKAGGGKATLNTANSYTGSTTIDAGTLALGSAGSISASPLLTVNSGAIFDVSAVSGYTVAAAQKLQGAGAVRGNATIAGMLAPGGSIGTLTFINNLVLNGNTLIELSRDTGTLANDQAVVFGTVTYGGSLVLTNIGPDALVAGDVFNVFPAASARNGSFTNILWPPLTAPLYWTNRLTLDGTVAVVSPVNVTPTNLVFQVLGGTNLVLSWPPDHTGWRLQSQTNNLATGLTGSWFDVAGSDGTNSVTVPVRPTDPCVFYRLVFP